MTIDAVLTADRGVASWRTLRKAGMTKTELAHALHDGALRRLRRGWYATADADPTVVAAVSANGVCSCVSALRLHGVWVSEGYSRVHTRARPSAHNVRGAAERFCHRHGRPQPEDGAVDDVATAFAHAIRCFATDDLVVAMDSIMNLGLMSRDQLEAALKSAPAAVRDLLERTADSGSGTETLVRLRLARLGVAVRTQVVIDGVGRVDMVVGTRLIIEVDGEEHHHRTEQFHADRARDLEAHRLGYISLRLTYRQVVHDWPATWKAIRAVIQRGEHLRALPDPDLTTEPAPSLP